MAILAATPALCWAVFPTPSAFDITGPGGFAAACATPDAGVPSAPHLPVSNGLLAASSACDARSYSGLRDMGYGDARWPATQAAVYSRSVYGRVDVDAATQQAQALATFSSARGNGGWADRLSVNLANPGAAGGHLLVWVVASGWMGAQGPAGSALASIVLLRDRQPLPDGAPGFAPGSASVGAGQQLTWDATAQAANGFARTTRSVGDLVRLSIPFVAGQSFELGVWGQAMAGTALGAAGVGASDSGVDFAWHWWGIAGVIVDGQLLRQGFTVESATGLNWLPPTAVPEPATWGLLAGGLGLVVAAARRRQPR